jgi:hypothetical protein
MTDPSPSAGRAVRVLGVVFLLYGALVASHQGEFWPLSIFPMFSQAGQPWTRALVRDVSDAPLDEWTAAEAREELPGAAFGLAAHGVNKLDVSNLVGKTERWTADRVDALRAVLAPGLGGRPGRRLLVLRATGSLTGDRTTTRFEPIALVGADTVAVNPSLPR